MTAGAQLAATLARIEKRQETAERALVAFEQVGRLTLDMLRIHNEKLDVILKAVTYEPPPSEAAALLREVLEAIRAQTAMLAELPDTIRTLVADEIERELNGVELREPDSGSGSLVHE